MWRLLHTRCFSDYNAERLRAADTLLLGRKSYEGFRSCWPAIAEDVSQPAVEREISRLNAAIEKVVVSESLGSDQVKGWGPTRVVRRVHAHAEVAALKEKPGREILVFGSHVLWNDLLASGLVDELHFMIGAGVVGEGVRAFETRPPGSLRLLDTRTFGERDSNPMQAACRNSKLRNQKPILSPAIP